MGGTRAGGIKARDTLMKKNPKHYEELGRIGGRLSKGGGFTPETAREAGRKGGKASRKNRDDN